MVPLRHHLIVHKMVLFWANGAPVARCPFIRGHCFILVPLGYKNSALFVDIGTVFQNVLVPFFFECLSTA